MFYFAERRGTVAGGVLLGGPDGLRVGASCRSLPPPCSATERESILEEIKMVEVSGFRWPGGKVTYWYTNGVHALRYARISR